MICGDEFLEGELFPLTPSRGRTVLPFYLKIGEKDCSWTRGEFDVCSEGHDIQRTW